MLKKYLLLLCVTAVFHSLLSAQEIVEVEFLKKRTLSEIRADYGPLAQNGVDLYRVLYATRDLSGLRDTASGLLIIPDLEAAVMPTLIYQHGTVSSKDDVPSLLEGGYQLAEAIGAFGYVTLAPDFLGLGTSRGFHPYVHAASEAWGAIDMLKAVRSYLPRINVETNSKLFVTGYSQGGHAAMALHRELEQNYADEFPVTAAAPMSGPYSIAGEMKKLFLSGEEYGRPSYLVYTILSYNEVYGLYEELEDYFDPDFVPIINQFYNHAMGLDNLNNLLRTGLRQKHDVAIPRLMLQDSVQQNILNDPGHPLNAAMADNDVYQWAPKAPTRLFYCTADDQVPYTNSLVARDTMSALGAADIEAVDVQSNADHGQCVFPAALSMLGFFAGFLDTETAAQSPPPADLRIFPNPARHELFVQGLPPGALVELFDLQGRPRGQWINRNEQLAIPIDAQWQGLHLLRMTTTKGTWTRKALLAPR